MASRAAAELTFILALVLVVVPASSSPSSASHGYRPKGFPFFLPWGQSNDCSSACPLHSCKIDPAVIHGYCCGCAKWLDRVPIRCPYNLHCPIQGSQLCRDYDFMMDCCC